MANWHDRRKNEVRQKFGLNVRQKRHAMNVSQQQLSELAKISSSYLGDIERGLRNVALENILALAEALQCKSYELMPDTNTEIKKVNQNITKEPEKMGLNITIKVSYIPWNPKTLYKPEDDLAKALTILMRKKNFSRQDIEKMRSLGFTVEVSATHATNETPEHLR